MCLYNELQVVVPVYIEDLKMEIQYGVQSANPPQDPYPTVEIPESLMIHHKEEQNRFLNF